MDSIFFRRTWDTESLNLEFFFVKIEMFIGFRRVIPLFMTSDKTSTLPFIAFYPDLGSGSLLFKE